MSPLHHMLKRIQEMESPGFPFEIPKQRQGPQAAVLVLFSGESFLQAEMLLMKRSSTVITHPDQIAFPGGGVEDRDQGSLIETALRETQEEVGLGREGIMPIGLLPELPTVSGGVWVTPVVAYASEKARRSILKLDSSEVAHSDWDLISNLLSTRKEESRSVRGVSVNLPEFQWKGERMWGMTALIFDLILQRYARIGK
ncbi:MAG: CoA pyrophosphatase [Bdellovibrionales bacterium]|nr:CoA pyrophosphatase [Bdellovibrionales bacterium]